MMTEPAYKGTFLAALTCVALWFGLTVVLWIVGKPIGELMIATTHGVAVVFVFTVLLAGCGAYMAGTATRHIFKRARFTTVLRTMGGLAALGWILQFAHWDELTFFTFVLQTCVAISNVVGAGIGLYSGDTA